MPTETDRMDKTEIDRMVERISVRICTDLFVTETAEECQLCFKNGDYNENIGPRLPAKRFIDWLRGFESASVLVLRRCREEFAKRAKRD